ncbi:MAG TPA: NAD(+)/NADH kinase, partial [bacterium]|nr:NAD(+)/NADH kinase [bacterium]
LPSFDIPILGLNFGKFGFLTMNCKNKVKTVKDVIAEQFFISPRIYLTAFLIAKNKKQFMGNALNEMVIFREDIRMVRFEIKFGSAIFQLRADGMIISTPTGSTAHAFSAGGPIVFPEEKTMIIVALAPFATTWRNCIYEGSRLLIKSSGNCNIVMDGQEKFTLQKDKPLEIKIGDGVFKLLVSKDWNFWKTLKEKFLWGKTLS